MTSNPLANRRAAPRETYAGLTFGTAAWCEDRNRTMARKDIEWVPDEKGGAYLRDKPSVSAARMEEGKRAAERERREYNHRQKYPITALRDVAA